LKINKNNVLVKIGSAPHPMTEAHHIEWVYLLTEKGGQRKCLIVDGDPSVSFSQTDDDKVVSAFAYCNLHGLWKTDL
jgi:superoxide reductase